MKKLFAILMSIMMIACFMPTMAFADGTDNVTVTVVDNKITGKKGEAITEQTVTITFTDNKAFADQLTGTGGWITNLPTGLTQEAMLKTEDNADKKIAIITISGKPEAVSEDPIAITIPQGSIVSVSEALTINPSDNAKFEILSEVPVPTAKDLTYNGQEQPAFEQNDAYTLGGTVKETNVGGSDYQAIITLNPGYRWSTGDDRSEVKKINWNIKKKTPEASDFTFTPPSVDLKYVENQAKTATVKFNNSKYKDSNDSLTVEYYVGDAKKQSATDAATYTVKVNVAENGNFAAKEGVTGDSENPWTFTIAKAEQAAPTETLAGEAPTTQNGQGKIKGTTTAMEYSTDKNFSSPAGAMCGANETAVDPGDYYVRYKEDNNHKPGTASEKITVPAYSAEKPPAGTEIPDSVMNAITAYTGTYDGVGHDAITGLSAAEGGYTVQYKVEGSDDFVDTVPQVKNVADCKKITVQVSKEGLTPKTKDLTPNITKATLTVTADNKGITYGDAVPAYTKTITGFVKNETEAVLSGALSYTCEYQQYSDVKEYDITPKGLASENYDITFTAGTLTVEQKEVGLNWAGYENLKFGDTVNVTATATGTVNDDKIAVTVSGGTDGAVGDHEATATVLTGDKANNYKLPTPAIKKYNVAKAIAGKVPTQYVLLARSNSEMQSVDLSSFIPDNALNLQYNIQPMVEDGLIDKTGESNKVDKVNKKYKFKLAAQSKYTAQKVTIEITSDNYETFSVEINVETTTAKIPKVKVTPITHTYDGKALNKSLITGSAVDATDDQVNVAGTFDWTDGAPTNVADSGKYNVTFTPNEAGYAAVTTVVNVTINKADHENLTDNETAKQGEAYQLDFMKKFNLQKFSYRGPQVNKGNDLFAVEPKFDGETGYLTFRFKKDAKVGETATITVQVNESANYNAFTITIKVTVAKKSSDSSSGGGSYYPYTPSTPSKPAAPNLDKTKTDSTTALNAAATANKYDVAEQAEVKKILDKANADIKNAKTEAEVKAIEEAAQAEIDKILTTEEKAIVAALDNVEKRDFATKSKVITRKGGKKVIRLTWTAPDGVDVDGYEIFRSTKKNSGFGKKPYFTTSNTRYTNTKDLKAGKTYYYKVRAFVVINGERVYTDYSLKANRKL